VRVSTAFNRALALPGTLVSSVAFTDAGIVIDVRRRGRRHRCPCGWSTTARYDSSRRRWRHLDFGTCQVFLQAQIARIECRACGRVRTEAVPWARPGARFTRDFEQVIGWLAQRMDKSSIAALMRCSWESVNAVVKRIVADHPPAERLDGLVRIGVDEISYKRGHKYLTVVADHDTGRVVWVAQGRTQAALEEFIDALGPQRASAIEVVTMDGSTIYEPVVRARLPAAEIALDPFHVMQWVNQTLDAIYRAEPSAPIEKLPGRPPSRRHWRATRTALRTGAERLDPHQKAMVNTLRRHRHRLWRAWELKEAFRDLYRRIHPAHAHDYLQAWCTSALRSRIPGYRHLVRKLRGRFEQITAAVELGLSNSRLEGINAKIRVIQRRGYGHPDPHALIAMIHLCLGGITLSLPGRPTGT
jgi:transposase